MWDEIFNMALQNGIWAVMFVGLFIFELKDSNNREKKYQKTITDLSDNLGIVKVVKTDVVEVKQNVHEIKKDVCEIKSKVESVKNKMLKKEKNSEI